MEFAMPVEAELLEILCCPVSKTPVTPLGRDKLDSLNAEITAGRVLYVDGTPVGKTLHEALITEDGKVIYPVVDGIPVMLAENGIGTTQFKDF